MSMTSVSQVKGLLSGQLTGGDSLGAQALCMTRPTLKVALVAGGVAFLAAVVVSVLTAWPENRKKN